MRTVARLSGRTLVVFGLVLAGRFSSQLGTGGHPTAGAQAGPGRSVPGNSVPSPSVPSSHVVAAPTQAPSTASADARLAATARADGGTGGAVVIPVPPAAPERCSPVHITVDVGQTTVVACRSTNYGGPITASVANPDIASVSTSGGLMIPRYLYLVGRGPGTAIVRVSYPHGPTTSYPITVDRAGT